ncbi:MAG: cytochrome c [Burkholderiales bacterium]|nr:cytochrome c [Burkholderiales bacterium]
MSDAPVTRQEGREKGDPYELETPIPAPVLALVAAMVAFGMAYILAAAPDQRPELGDQRTLADLAAAPGAKAGAAKADGAAIYAARCAACHQASGLGLPGVFPPLAGSEWVNGKPELLASILLHGVQGRITVKGLAFDGVMPAFKDQLDDESLAAVASYARAQWGNAGAPIPAGTVASVREKTASRDTPWQGDAELAAVK